MLHWKYPLNNKNLDWGSILRKVSSYHNINFCRFPQYIATTLFAIYCCRHTVQLPFLSLRPTLWHSWTVNKSQSVLREGGSYNLKQPLLIARSIYYIFQSARYPSDPGPSCHEKHLFSRVRTPHDDTGFLDRQVLYIWPAQHRPMPSYHKIMNTNIRKKLDAGRCRLREWDTYPIAIIRTARLRAAQ